MDPERMMDNTTDPLELTLLQAGRADGMSEASRHGILTGLGLMLPLAGLGTALPGTAAATPGALPSGVSRIDTGPVDAGVDTFGSQSGVVQTGGAQAGGAQAGGAQAVLTRTASTRTGELGTTSGAGTVSGAGSAAGGSIFAGKSAILAAAAIVTGALAIWSTHSAPGGAEDASVAGGASVAAAASIAVDPSGTGGSSVTIGSAGAKGDRSGSKADNQVLDPARGADSQSADSRGVGSPLANGGSGSVPSGSGSRSTEPGSANAAGDASEFAPTDGRLTEQRAGGTVDTGTIDIGTIEQRAEAAARTPAPAARGAALRRGQLEDGRVRRPTGSDGSRVAQARAGEPGSPPSERRAKQDKKRGESPSEDVSTLSVELELIDSARKALRSSSPRAALQKLDEYGARFPSGRLRTEATILRIEALMAAGERAAASRLGKSVLDRAPNSPYARRVRSLLGDE